MSKNSAKLLTKSFVASALINISLFILCYSLLSNFVHNKKPLEVVLLVDEPKSSYLVESTHQKSAQVLQKSLPVTVKNKQSPHKNIEKSPSMHKPISFYKEQTNPTQSSNFTDTTQTQNTQKVDNDRTVSKHISAQFYETNSKQNDFKDNNIIQSISKEDYAFLRKLIEKNLNYPYLARRNGYQGTVVVSFIIDKGTFKDILVAKSSGYAILDKTALEAVRKIEHYVNISENVKIVLPINFKLNAE